MTVALPSLVFRIAKAEYCKTHLEALSGMGGTIVGGRWHSKGQRIIYTSQNSTLALLERLIHGDESIAERRADQMILNIVLPAISSIHYTASELAAEDEHWRQEGNPLCRHLGDKWLSSQTSCALIVPAAVNDLENNILLNPTHPDFAYVISANASLVASPINFEERVAAIAKYTRRKKTSG